MTAWHATEPTTPYLSLHARVRELTVDDVAAALYDERSLDPRDGDAADAVDRRPRPRSRRGRMRGGVSPTSNGAQLAKEAVELEAVLGADWIDDASDRVVECLTGREMSAAELRAALPDLGGTFTAAPGTKWSTEVPTMTRLLVDPDRFRRGRARTQRRPLADLPVRGGRR